jgi:mRNA-degrading endonuclease YafQ of YafQ-DinJ toxin-antitoxin module
MIFKTCKFYEKTLGKQEASVKNKIKEFMVFKHATPRDKFGSSDYAFSASGHFAGFWHAKLSFDISIIYKIEGGFCYLYGVFSHDDIGTGQPPNKNKQATIGKKLKNQQF